MSEMNKERELLPGRYEGRYKSENLKAQIADIGMWSMIPAVSGGMNSKNGLERLRKNNLLFSFIDEFFPDFPFAFEPYMRDGRFVFLPEDVGHQGIGICVSNELPGFLEIGHFWYPGEFTEKKTSVGMGQVYVPMFSARPGADLAIMVRQVYTQERQLYQRYCTFPFEPDLIVTLRGNFLDRMGASVKQIRDAIKGRSIQTQRNGEGLINFMQRIMQ